MRGSVHGTSEAPPGGEMLSRIPPRVSAHFSAHQQSLCGKPTTITDSGVGPSRGSCWKWGCGSPKGSGGAESRRNASTGVHSWAMVRADFFGLNERNDGIGVIDQKDHSGVRASP